LTLDEAVALVRRTRSRRGRPSIGWASLTPTEMEVVRLVVDRLTNPQIGAKGRRCDRPMRSRDELRQT
jgi:DNA-binding NarL/FixJ family response regulator